MSRAVVFQAASLLLSYPDEQLIEQLDSIEEALQETAAAVHFEPVLTHLRSMPLVEAQAWHVQEFDLSRRHALHLTYWTDGDTRRRGEVLAAIKQTYRDSGLWVDLGGELPDFLPVVLEFAATGDPERGVELLHQYRASLELLRLGLAEDQLPHEGILIAICAALGGVSPSTRAEVQQLLVGPPQETVGLDATFLPYPQLQGSSR